MTNDPQSPIVRPQGLEEKAAAYLNATMVTAIGLALTALSAWHLFTKLVELKDDLTAGRWLTRHWMELPLAFLMAFMAFQVVRFAVRMFRSI